jgi:hypothetical protein
MKLLQFAIRVRAAAHIVHVKVFNMEVLHEAEASGSSHVHKVCSNVMFSRVNTEELLLTELPRWGLRVPGGVGEISGHNITGANVAERVGVARESPTQASRPGSK